MIRSEIRGVQIAGISCAVPTTRQSTDDYREAFGKRTVDGFQKMVGVKERRLTAKGQTASDLAFAAARDLIARKGVDPSSIGALVFVTQSPDYKIPATACVLAHRLGLSKDCMAYDVNLGCSGYVYGVNDVASLMASSNIEAALLLVGDTSNDSIAPGDRSSCMLFGEAGSATLLVKEPDASIKGAFRTDGSGFKAIIIPAGAHRNPDAPRERAVWGVDGNERSDYDLYMNGTDVFSFTISEVPAMIREFMAGEGVAPEEVDVYAMHQANRFILDQVADRSGIPKDRMPVSMDRYGNTSVTSIPLTLCDAFGGEGGRDLRVLMCGFGIGLSWGVVDTRISADDILPVIESDEVYQEGAVSHD